MASQPGTGKAVGPPLRPPQKPFGASPAVVVEAKEVAAWLARGVLPVAGAPNRQPVVEGARLQVVHHRLIPPHPVGKGNGQPAAKGWLAGTRGAEMALSGYGLSSASYAVCKGNGQPAAQGAGLKTDISAEGHRKGRTLVPAVSSPLCRILSLCQFHLSVGQREDRKQSSKRGRFWNRCDHRVNAPH